ncbi:hypothetical protein AWM75_05060 [Aerococcus urinaehominis]|uniref:Uncharacterized protein n=1 Tax=Aerococcus urinaehominis TaxID=128944 RepID=A0A109RGK2_9LACT|nr:hypothetical protein [Aerococcus urinaehominis]AMB99400.1 hypothetical protein AWM75_05060 [Aerococcus urinaehominis]SDM23914.1 protein of unknown function [Aerococcus urinaehominis]
MPKTTFISNIIFKLIFAIAFVYLAYSIVLDNGWTFFALLALAFASSDIVQAINIFRLYRRLK